MCSISPLITSCWHASYPDTSRGHSSSYNSRRTQSCMDMMQSFTKLTKSRNSNYIYPDTFLGLVGATRLHVPEGFRRRARQELLLLLRCSQPQRHCSQPNNQWVRTVPFLLLFGRLSCCISCCMDGAYQAAASFRTRLESTRAACSRPRAPLVVLSSPALSPCWKATAWESVHKRETHVNVRSDTRERHHPVLYQESEECRPVVQTQVMPAKIRAQMAQIDQNCYG